jgi:hypothetical protein
MAHFAKINENNEVLKVLTIDNKDVLNFNQVEEELIGQQYLETHNNWPAHLWIQTSYNTYENTHRNNGTPFRGNYACIGHTWDEDNQIFWAPQPYSSWIKDISTASWKSPIGDAPAMPEEQALQNEAKTHLWYYNWNEDAYQSDNTQGWELINGLA